MPRIRGAADIEALRPRSRATYERVLEALAEARRENLTVRRAAARAGVSVTSVKKYAGEALERDAFGRLVAKPADRFYRRMKVLTPEGPQWVSVRGSKKASLVGEHWAAVGQYLATGEEERLSRYRGVAVAGLELEAEPEAIEEWARRGEVSFEDLYEFAS